MLARKKSLARGVATYGPPPGFKGRTFELWVLNKWVLNLLRPQYPTARRKDRTDVKVTYFFYFFSSRLPEAISSFSDIQ